MKNNTIIIDANPLVTSQKTGVGMYTQRLMTALAEQKSSESINIVGYYYNFLGRKKPNLPEGENITYRQIRIYPGIVTNFLRRFGLNIPVEILAKTRGDIVLYPNFIAQPSIFRSPSYAVIHDLSYITHLQYASEKNRKDLERFVPKTLQHCEGIITVSEYSKQIISTIYDYPTSKIIVTHIPPEKKLELDESKIISVLHKYAINKPYLLFLGTLEPRKNIVTLLDAYENDKRLHENYQLVLAGGMDWKFESIKQRIENLQKRGFSIVHCGYISDTERAALYSKARAFILPSHEEGFGMPILEAMQYNVPVAISDIPVFHEVANDAAIYFNQNDPQDIAGKLNNLLEDGELQKTLVERGRINLRRYNWDDVARSVLEFINAK